MTIQESGGATVDRAVAAIHDMPPLANEARREVVGAAHLILALQCGGSDDFLGLSADPALGVAADLTLDALILKEAARGNF